MRNAIAALGVIAALLGPQFGHAEPTLQQAVQQANAPDAILVDGKIITLDSKESVAQALAVRDGKILAVGSSADIMQLAGQKTAVVRLGGRTVIPGLIDSHIHAIRDARMYSQIVDVSEARSINDISDALRAAGRKKAPGEWLIVFGNWNKDMLAERRAPTPEELDQAGSNHPVVVLLQYDLMVFNRLGLQTLGIRSPADLPSPLKVEMGADGRPTGVIHTTGGALEINQLLGRIFPHQSFEDEVSATIDYFHVLNSVGLTGVVDEGGFSGLDKYHPVFAVWSRGKLSLRVRYDAAAYNMEGMVIPPDVESTKTMMQMLPPLWGDEWLRMVGIGENTTVGMYDGSIFSPDVPRTPEAKQKNLEFSLWAAQRGYSLNNHSPHDSTARAFLDVYEEINKTIPLAPLRWKLSHCEHCTVDTIRRMKALGMGLVIQDRLYFDGDDYIAKWGLEDARRAPAVMTATRLGVPVSAGSDAGVVAPYNPFIGLYWLVTGRSVIGTPTRAPEELASRMDALRMYTLNSAWTSFEEHERGSLESKKFADLVVLDRDYMTIPVDDIRNIKPLLTMVGGKAVYAAGPFAGLAKGADH